jgi:hypothetical protein
MLLGHASTRAVGILACCSNALLTGVPAAVAAAAAAAAAAGLR